MCHGGLFFTASGGGIVGTRSDVPVRITARPVTMKHAEQNSKFGTSYGFIPAIIL
jgi:hypothetical protein